MTGEEQVHPNLGVLPDELVGKAIIDRGFRAEVLKLVGKKDDLERFLADKGFNDLSVEALNFIAGLTPQAVNGVLRGVDFPTNKDFDASDDPRILAS